MSKVSVITPVFNRPEFLEEAVKSIQSQTYADWEHIIIDDGSVNPLTQIALEKIGQYPNVTIYRTENKGVGHARNYGIEKSTGEYILTLDDDDMWESSFIDKAINIFNTESNTGVVTSWMKEFGARNRIIKPDGGGVANFLIHNNSVHAMYKKKYWAACGKYDETKFIQPYADWDLWLRITALGLEVAVVQELCFSYRIHKNSSMLKDAEVNHLELFKYIVEKNKHIYQAYITEVMCLFERKLINTRKNLANATPINRLKKIFKKFGK